jgi:nicotinate-nucleotide adenylyltransferase
VAAATAARDQLSLDRVLLVVANDPWQKAPRHPVSPAADRLAMVEAACGDLRGIEASALEVARGGPSYTIDTVEELLSAPGPPAELFMIVGADLVGDLETWHRVGDLRALVTLAVVTRPGSETEAAPPGWRCVEVRGVDVDVSSSRVRRLVAEGRSVEGLAPDAVIRCIRRRALYAVAR